MWYPTHHRLLLASLAASVAIACSDEPTGITDSPLAGLQQAQGTDSAGTMPPPPPPTLGPGYVHGTVLGPSQPGAGNDSLNTAPRIANARIVAYPRIQSTTDTLALGAAVAEVVTGADGKFQLPTLPGGLYVVTITPPAGSPYGGVWVTGYIHATSHEHPWWVVLWMK